jgi:hypothetical protein
MNKPVGNRRLAGLFQKFQERLDDIDRHREDDSRKAIVYLLGGKLDLRLPA